MSVAFELPAELTIYGALEIRDALLAWVAQHSDKSDRVLDISAKEVAEVDGSGLQLLAALTNMEVSWQLVAASPAFSEACRTLGLSHWVDSLPSSEA
jgi:anti-anti-sigma regulatory factor